MNPLASWTAVRGSLAAELVGLVPHSARRILDIGCGTGEFGRSLKARQPAEVIGVEPDPAAAALARQHLDDVVSADVETWAAAQLDGTIDCVVCADLLSCLQDPLVFLRRARGWLAPAGSLIVGTPNLRHHSALAALLGGRWQPPRPTAARREPLRFFTRRELEKVLCRADFQVAQIHPVANPEWEERRLGGFAGPIQVGALQLQGLTPADAEEYFVRDYLTVATPAPESDWGTTSIVLITFNQLRYTRECLTSIRLRTDEPVEIIVVDNASTDGTVDYLQSLPGVKVIANRENRGFPAAANQGIQAATGRQILLLNNDTLVTTGWLRRMLRTLQSDPRIGLVGPCSNFVSGEQQVPVSYDDDLMSLDGFAWEWGKARQGIVEDTNRLVGFCFLIRRDVVERIGGLDERFGLGCFEDDDYCLRALQAGFRAVIARDAFVHHFGGRTFVGSGVDFSGLMKRNQQLFREKWAEVGQPAPCPTANAPAAPSYLVRRAEGGGLQLVPRDLTLSLCMIVRDSARTLEPCLRSIRPWVDEMIVVDTGSRDHTPELAARLGARVFRFPWPDSFSIARNESLRHARGRWIFWMDSDDTIDATNGRQLRALVARPADPAVLGYVVQVHCPGAGDAGCTDLTIVDHVKLLRNLPELRFEGRIHEQILPAIRRLGGTVAWTDVFVVHSGYDHSPAGQEQKKQRDLHLLHLELQERPEHPFTLFNLGMTYADLAQYEKAVEFLKQSLTLSGEGDSHLRKVYALLVYCAAQLGQPAVAWEICTAGLRHFPEDTELHFRRGLLLQQQGRLEEAVAAYQRVLERRGGRYFSSLDQGLYGFKTRQNLAVTYADLGDLARAEEQWRQVIAEVPHYRPGWQGLGEVLLTQGRHADAQEVAERLQGDPSLHAAGSILQGRLAVARGETARAREILGRAVRETPEDAELWEHWCRFLFEHGEAEETVRALQKLLHRVPEDAAALHNLGAIYYRQGRRRQAAEALRQSLRLRPDAPHTRALLQTVADGAD